MSCAGNCGRQRQDLIDKWTSGLEQLLVCSEGRQEFRDFLLSNGFPDEEIVFWESIDSIQRSINRSDFSRDDLNNQLKKLHKEADDNDINFDSRQIRELKECYKIENIEDIKESLKKFKEWTKSPKLGDYYRKFCEKYIKKLSSSTC